MSSQVTTASPELAARHSIERLLKIKEVETLTAQHRQTIWRKCKAGTFPKPRKLGPINVWPEGEIRAWLTAVIQPVAKEG